MSTSAYLFMLAAGLCSLAVLAGCSDLAVSKPFVWPGLHARQPGPQERVLVAVTHAQLGSHRTAFFAASRQVLDQLDGQPGLVGYSVRSRLFGQEVWTVTVWSDDASLEAFVRSPAHLQAMRAGQSALRTMQYHRFEMPVAELPLDWRRVLDELARAAPAQAAPQG